MEKYMYYTDILLRSVHEYHIVFITVRHKPFQPMAVRAVALLFGSIHYKNY